MRAINDLRTFVGTTFSQLQSDIGQVRVKVAGLRGEPATISSTVVNDSATLTLVEDAIETMSEDMTAKFAGTEAIKAVWDTMVEWRDDLTKSDNDSMRNDDVRM
jgi:hypothetical protein